MSRTNDDIAEAWAKALGADLTSTGELMAPDARIWHSNDGMWITREESERRMAAAGIATKGPLFEEVRAQPTRDGVLVQGALRPGVAGPNPMHIVQVLTVENGLVVTIEEYLAAQRPPG